MKKILLLMWTVLACILVIVGAVSASSPSKTKYTILPPFTTDKECLALHIYWEAKSKPIGLQVAIGQAIMHRVKSPDFPDNICDVIYQHNDIEQSYPAVTDICQFNWFCDETSDIPTDEKAFQKILEVAEAVIEIIKYDFIEGAQYYGVQNQGAGWPGLFVRTITIEGFDFLLSIPTDY